MVLQVVKHAVKLILFMRKGEFIFDRPFHNMSIEK